MKHDSSHRIDPSKIIKSTVISLTPFVPFECWNIKKKAIVRISRPQPFFPQKSFPHLHARDKGKKKIISKNDIDRGCRFLINEDDIDISMSASATKAAIAFVSAGAKDVHMQLLVTSGRHACESGKPDRQWLGMIFVDYRSTDANGALCVPERLPVSFIFVPVFCTRPQPFCICFYAKLSWTQMPGWKTRLLEWKENFTEYWKVRFREPRDWTLPDRNGHNRVTRCSLRRPPSPVSFSFGFPDSLLEKPFQHAIFVEKRVKWIFISQVERRHLSDSFDFFSAFAFPSSTMVFSFDWQFWSDASQDLVRELGIRKGYSRLDNYSCRYLSEQRPLSSWAILTLVRAP